MSFSFVGIHKVPLFLFLQPDKVLLNDSASICNINYSSQFYVYCKLAKSALSPIIQVSNEEVKQYWTEYWPLGHTTSDWPPAGLSRHWSQLFQLSLWPAALCLQQISGWLKEPKRTKACECEASSSCLKKDSSLQSSWSGSPQQTPTTTSPMLICPLILTHKPSLAHHSAIGIAPCIPAVLSHKGQLLFLAFTACPSWRVFIDPSQHKTNELYLSSCVGSHPQKLRHHENFTPRNSQVWETEIVPWTGNRLAEFWECQCLTWHLTAHCHARYNKACMSTVFCPGWLDLLVTWSCDIAEGKTFHYATKKYWRKPNS